MHEFTTAYRNAALNTCLVMSGYDFKEQMCLYVYMFKEHGGSYQQMKNKDIPPMKGE